MRTKEVKFPLTPITEETFIRQGWRKCDVNEPLFEELGEGLDDLFDEMEDDEIEEPEEPLEDASELMKRIQQKLSRKYYGNFEEPTTVEGSDEELMIL